ncbi:hypothetical protein [Streptomyces sp. 3214.6]|uniref:hypothetical protein n=1 Tax=Streptomyces sp. 3214.6 TaxID=1882757 RepID=UPI00090BF7D3|nr:hypothetical protein [Streptomyces sp. 3214.6]SHI66205.1 hypothetical protein SAMN05444521_8169 [Streptomyces sp. 3214.6]
MREGLQPDATNEQLRNQMQWFRSELAGARSTLQHMSRAMSWLGGHDRLGLDHLEEAMREARARERAVDQARQWAARAREAERLLEQLREAVPRDWPACEPAVPDRVTAAAVHQVLWPHAALWDAVKAAAEARQSDGRP